LLKKAYSLRDIAKAIKRAVSSISDEIKRNTVKGEYEPKKAHHKAWVRRKNAKYQGKKIVTNMGLRIFVENTLYDDQSPEAIAGRLKEKRENDLPYVSKDSIYRYIKSPYGRNIESHRKRHKRRRHRKRKKVTQLQDRTFIDKRPKSIDSRAEIGDTEADFIVSGKTGTGILLVVVCRKARYSCIEKITKVTIPEVHWAFHRIKKRLSEMKSVTTDNDILLKKHKKLERELKVTIYFCHPYHSWEKGTVENTNKHIRKSIPKGSDISKYSKKFIQKVEEKLNRRIMKCLQFHTPQEVIEIHRKKKNLLQTKKSP
jgi:IS30 family transposase